MSGVKIERVLVQGTVTFTVSCNVLMGMVTPKQAANEDFMKSWFEDKAFELIDSADAEVDYDNKVPIKVSEEMANKLTGEIISDLEWKVIMAENRESE